MDFAKRHLVSSGISFIVFRHSCFFFETFITNEQLIWVRKTFSTNIQIKAKISPILGRLFYLIQFTVGHIKKILKSTLSQLKIVLFCHFPKPLKQILSHSCFSYEGKLLKQFF